MAQTNRWRTADIVVTAVIAVAFGAVFAGWNTLYLSVGEFNAFPPGKAVMVGVWLIPAVLAPLIVRKPGAGVFAETVAAILATFLGSPWGAATVLYGLAEGAGGEAGFAATSYRSFGLPTALAGGAAAGAVAGLLDIVLYFPGWTVGWQLAQVGIAAASGLVIAGLGSWLLAKGLAQTGVLDQFPSGRRHRVEV